MKYLFRGEENDDCFAVCPRCLSRMGLSGVLKDRDTGRPREFWHCDRCGYGTNFEQTKFVKADEEA